MAGEGTCPECSSYIGLDDWVSCPECGAVIRRADSDPYEDEYDSYDDDDA